MIECIPCCGWHNHLELLVMYVYMGIFESLADATASTLQYIRRGSPESATKCHHGESFDIMGHRQMSQTLTHWRRRSALPRGHPCGVQTAKSLQSPPLQTPSVLLRIRPAVRCVQVVNHTG